MMEKDGVTLQGTNSIQINYIGKNETPIQHQIELSNDYMEVLERLYNADNGNYLLPTVRQSSINEFLKNCTNVNDKVTCRHLRNYYASMQYETCMNMYIKNGMGVLEAHGEAMKAVSNMLGHKHVSKKLLWFYIDERLKIKFAVQYGGNKYYEVYLQMGAVSLSSPAFKDEGDVSFYYTQSPKHTHHKAQTS